MTGAILVIGALLLVQSALSIDVSVKSINCVETPIRAEECLLVTNQGQIMFAGLESFEGSDQAFSGSLYSATGEKIEDSEVTVTKHDDDNNAATMDAFVIIAIPGDQLEAIELECVLSTGVCQEHPVHEVGNDNDEVKHIPDIDLATDLYDNVPLDRQSKTLPAQGFKLKTQILYDKAFAARFDEDETKISNAIKRIVVQANVFLKLKSLTTKVQINTTGLPFIALDGFYRATGDNLDRLKPIVNAMPQEAYSFTVLSYENDAFGTIGIAWSPSTCVSNSNKGYRVNINEYKDDDMSTAATVSHEIGHNLGMGHDFGDDNAQRYDSNGNACRGIGGIMDYNRNGRTQDKWSTCSVEDFTKYYNRVRTWCLPLLTEADNGGNDNGSQSTTTTKLATTTTTTTTTTSTTITTTTAPSRCTDSYRYCSYIRRYCSPRYVLRGYGRVVDVCKKTCNRCSTGSAITRRPTTCRDRWGSYCARWKQYCDVSRRVAKYCKKSCNEC